MDDDDDDGIAWTDKSIESLKRFFHCSGIGQELQVHFVDSLNRYLEISGDGSYYEGPATYPYSRMLANILMGLQEKVRADFENTTHPTIILNIRRGGCTIDAVMLSDNHTRSQPYYNIMVDIDREGSYIDLHVTISSITHSLPTVIRYAEHYY